MEQEERGARAHHARQVVPRHEGRRLVVARCDDEGFRTHFDDAAGR